MDVELIVQLMAGILGGSLVGGISKRISLGFLGNSLVGIIGAFSAYQVGLLSLFGLDFGTMEAYFSGADIGALVNRATEGVFGGALLMTVVGLAKGALVQQ